MISVKFIASTSLLVLLVSLLVVFFQSRTQTFCYASIKTLSAPENSCNCFTVSKSGAFSKVFSLDTASSKKYRQEGHVLPGLWDGHGHLLQYGEMLHSVNLFDLGAIDEARERIHRYASEHSEEGTRDQWIRGLGWDQAAFEGTMPTAVRDIS